MKRQIVIDNRIGETRAGIYEGRKCVELYIRRWSDAQRPLFGDIWTGRVRSIDKNVEGAFIELGGQQDGFLRFNTRNMSVPNLTEGQSISVRVKREGSSEKSPIVDFVKVSEDKTGLQERKTLEQTLRATYPDASVKHARVTLMEGATERKIALPGGGDICIEQTRALLAIDVDKGRAQKNLDVCLAALNVISDQLRLRGLGGLIVIDLPNLRVRAQREKVVKHMEERLEHDPAITKLGVLSRFGTLEMTRAIRSRSIDAYMRGPDGELTLETRALELIQRCEHEARLAPGAQMTLYASPDIFAWLGDVEQTLKWADMLKDRIGARFKLVKSKVSDVVADR